MFRRILSKLGQNFISFFFYIGDMSILLVDTFIASILPPFNRKRITEQMSKIGIDSLPLVFLTAIFTGMVLAFQSAYQMQKISGEIYVASLVALSLTRELAPVLTALVVAGRVGASITAELGTMGVTEQIDALESLGTNPIKYLVVPRFYGLLFMLPILTIYADIVGMLGGYLVGILKLNLGSTFYLTMTFQSLTVKDIFTGLIKSFAFAIIICVIACYEGLSTKKGVQVSAQGVGKATTLSIVTSFILIIAVDCLFTVLFYVIF